MEVTIKINTINKDVLKKDIEEALNIIEEARDILYDMELVENGEE